MFVLFANMIHLLEFFIEFHFHISMECLLFFFFPFSIECNLITDAVQQNGSRQNAYERQVHTLNEMTS